MLYSEVNKTDYFFNTDNYKMEKKSYQKYKTYLLLGRSFPTLG